jgi:hypothetical protein
MNQAVRLVIGIGTTWFDNPVHGRQYSGRLVRVTNDKLFDSPIYNYTCEFPFMWEELRLPISYKDDRQMAERVLLESAERQMGEKVERAREAFARLREHSRMVHAGSVSRRRLSRLWVCHRGALRGRARTRRAAEELRAKWLSPIRGERLFCGGRPGSSVGRATDF